MIALWFLVCSLALIGFMSWRTWKDMSRRKRDAEATPEQIELLRTANSMADEYEERYQPLRKGGGAND